MKVLFIFELFFYPFDEGVKKLAFMIHSAIPEEYDTRLVHDISGLPNWLNSILLIPRICIIVLIWRPDKVIFIPKGALTFFGFIKAWMIEKITSRRLSIISVQKKRLSRGKAWIVRRIKLHNIFTLSHSMSKELNNLGQHAKILFVGIDRDNFAPVDNISHLRKKYRIPVNRPVVLHVGHIKKSRNIAWLGEVQKQLPDLQVVLVGSTATEQDLSLALELEHKGVIVIKESLPAIHEVYQLSTWYCFPVQIEDAAMETPLSVLEAMSTNLPVITTRFGRIPELFTEDNCLRYIESIDDLILELQKGLKTGCNNREKTKAFTWQRTAGLLLK